MKTTVKFLLSTLVAATAMNTTAQAAEIYVNSDYNSSTEGWGTTHFANYSSAYAYATANAKDATIVIEKTKTLSGNTFDNNHKNYSKLKVEVKDGASIGNALSKWDMTYNVIVSAGGSIVMARPKSASVSNVHLKSKLIVGEAGNTKRANLHLLSDEYQDGDISIRYNGSLTAYNADITVQDLDAQGKMSLTDSTVKVAGALATASFFKAELIRTQMTVGGTLISGGLSDFAGGTKNQLGNFSMEDSMLTFGEGSVVKIAGNVEITDSSITAGTLECSKKISVYGDCSLTAVAVTGNKIVVTKGATLTVSSNSLLAMIDNSANEASGNGNIAFNKVESEVTTKEITLKSVDGEAVQLTANAEITISSASEITEAAAIEAIESKVAGGVVLSAWDFEIENAEAGVTVTMDVGSGQKLEDIRIFHGENGDWTDVTDSVTGKELKDGKLSFTTNSFSGYAAVAIPEPSAFGLFAGLGALLLVGARRRRR